MEGKPMRACSSVCIIIVVFILIDQCYSGLNWERLFIGGFIGTAIWTDCSRWLR
ncbi:hypothetical protein [Sporomusa termitida]|uniref:hypothetical protein n=1 Tax=Sporomusa termitida TaxID=2377 RepID=UPI001478660F|nr:hypothetical protein [Sporomusa termitida]